MADPGQLAANLLQKNFHLFGSFRKLCTYKETGDSVYDAQTGINAPTIISEQPDVWIIFDDIGSPAKPTAVQKYDDVPILSIDKKAIFPSLDLNVTPSVEDIIVDDVGVEWTVKAISQDSKPAHYSLHVRPTKAA